MMMGPRLRKLALTTHVACSVGFVGAVAAFLVLAAAGLTSDDTRTVAAAYIAMELTTWSLIVPLSFAALVTGLVQSLGTPWGLFRHYWVLTKLLLTVFTTIVLLLQTSGIGYMAALARTAAAPAPELTSLRSSLVMHAAGGLVVLLMITALSTFKPRGLTRYGWRRRREHKPPPRA